jgi:hypothetical protein
MGRKRALRMCYSAQILADYRKFVRTFGATMSIKEFARLFFERADGSKANVPKAMEDAFFEPQLADEFEIKAYIDRFNADQVPRLEQLLFEQRARLAEADRKLQTKVTKTATEIRRIATVKIARTIEKLDDMKRVVPKVRDSRIYPGQYALVMVSENGQRVIKPCAINAASPTRPHRST